jgi:lysozyme family protein
MDDRALTFVLQREGGYVNNPADPGGETNMGISKRNHPTLDIKNLTVAQASDIYEREYWQAAGCDQLPWPASLVVFDTAVNMGVSTARSLWAAAGGVDGMLWARLDRYRQIVQNRAASAPFLPGWIRRMVLLHDAAR